MSKKFYKNFFAECKDFVKLNYFCKQVGINQANLTKFINGYDGALTIANCELLYNSIINGFKKIV